MRVYRFRGRYRSPDGVQEFEAPSLKDLISFFFRNLPQPDDLRVPLGEITIGLENRIRWLAAISVVQMLEPYNPDELLAHLLQVSSLDEFEAVGVDGSDVIFYKRFAPKDGTLVLAENLTGSDAESAWNRPTTLSTGQLQCAESSGSGKTQTARLPTSTSESPRGAKSDSSGYHPRAR